MTDSHIASTSPNGSSILHLDVPHLANTTSDNTNSKIMQPVNDIIKTDEPSEDHGSNSLAGLSDNPSLHDNTAEDSSHTSTMPDSANQRNQDLVSESTHKDHSVQAETPSYSPRLSPSTIASSRPVLLSLPPPARKALQLPPFSPNIPTDAPRQRFIPPPRPASTRNIPLPPRSPRSPGFPSAATLSSIPSPPLSPPSQQVNQDSPKLHTQSQASNPGISSLMNVPPLSTRGGPGLPPPHIPDDVDIVPPPSYAPPPPPQHLLKKLPQRQLHQARPSTAPGGSRNTISHIATPSQLVPIDTRLSMVPQMAPPSTETIVAALNMPLRPSVPSRNSSIKKGSIHQRPSTAQPVTHTSNASTHTIPLAIPTTIAPPTSPPSQPIPPVPIAQNNTIYNSPTKSRASLATQRSRPISDVSAVLPPAFSMDGLPDPSLFTRASLHDALPREAIVDARRDTIKRFEEQKRKEEQERLEKETKLDQANGNEPSDLSNSAKAASTATLPSTDPTTVSDEKDQGTDPNPDPDRDREASTSSSAANEASLEMVLSDPILLRAFEGFLVNHISEESLIFLKALWQCRKDCAVATAQAAQAAAFAKEAEEEAAKAEEAAAQVATELDDLREKEQPSIASVLDDRKDSVTSQPDNEGSQQGSPFGSRRPSSGGFFQSAALLEAINKQRHAEALANEKTAAASAAIADAQNIAKINAGLMEWNIKRMISHFIHPTSPMEVQITPQCRRELLQKIEKTVTTWDEHVLSLFDEAEQQIMRQLRARIGDFNREIDWELSDMYIRSGPKANQKRVLIIGGGFCGQSVASTLDKMPRFHVTLVDNKDYWEYTPAIVKMIVDPQASHIRVPHQNYVRNGTVLIGNVDEIRSDCAVLAPRRVIPFHYCVIATGSSYTSQMKTATVSTSYRAKRLYLEYQSLRRANVVLVVGGGLVGVEIATIIAADFPGKRVTLVEANSRLLKRTGPLVHEKVMRRMRHLNIEVVLNERIIESSADRKRFKSDKGRIYECDKVYIATGQIARGQLMRGSLNRLIAAQNGESSPRTPLSPGFMSKSPEANRSSSSRLPLPDRNEAEIFASYLDETGKIRVEPSLQLKYHPHIFAGGDVSANKDEKTYQGAIFCGVTIARNICRLEKGLPPISQGSKGTRLYSAKPTAQTIYIGDNIGLFVYKFKYAWISKRFYQFREFLERWTVGTVSSGNNISLYFGRSPRALGSIEEGSKRKFVPKFSSKKTKTVLPDENADEHNDFDGMGEESTDSAGDIENAKAALGLTQMDLTGMEDDDGSTSTHTGSSLAGEKAIDSSNAFPVNKFKVGKSGKPLKSLQAMFQEASKASSKFAQMQGHVMTPQESRYYDAADHLEVEQGIIDPDEANATIMSSNETSESYDSLRESTSPSTASPPLSVQQSALHASLPISRAAPGPIPAKAALLLGVVPKPRKDQTIMSPPTSSAGPSQHLGPQPINILRNSQPPPPVPPKDPGYMMGSLPDSQTIGKSADCPRSSSLGEAQAFDASKSSTSLHSHVSSEAAIDGQSNPDTTSGTRLGHARRQGSTSSSLFTWSDKPTALEGADLPSPVAEDAMSQQRSPRNAPGIPGKAAQLLGLVDRPTSSASQRAQPQETLTQDNGTPELASDDEDDASYDGSWEQEAAARDFDFSYFDEDEVARGRSSSAPAIQDRLHNRRGSHSSTTSSRNGIPAKAVALLGVLDPQVAPLNRKVARSSSFTDMNPPAQASRYGGPILPPSTIDSSLSIDVSHFGMDTPTLQFPSQYSDLQDISPSTPLSTDASRASALSSVSTGTNDTIRPPTIRSTSTYSVIDPSFLTPDSGISEGLLNAIRLMEQAEQEEKARSSEDNLDRDYVSVNNEAPLSPLREEPLDDYDVVSHSEAEHSQPSQESGLVGSSSSFEDAENLSSSSSGLLQTLNGEQGMDTRKNVSTSTIDDILSDSPREVRKSSKAAALLGIDPDSVPTSPMRTNQRSINEQSISKSNNLKYVPLMQAASGNLSDTSIDSPSSKLSSSYTETTPIYSQSPPSKSSLSAHKGRAASPSIGSAGQFFKSLTRRGTINSPQDIDQADDAYGGIATISPSSDTLRKQSVVTPWELQDERQVSRDTGLERSTGQDGSGQISEQRLGSSHGSQGWGLGPQSGGIGASPGTSSLHHQPSSHGGGTVGKLFTKQLAKARLSSVTTRASSSYHDSSMQ